MRVPARVHNAEGMNCKLDQVKASIHLPKMEKKEDKKKEDKKKDKKEDKMMKEEKDKKEDKKENKKKEKEEKEEEKKEEVEEMTEEQIASAREEALGKLDKPLEKMKIKELLALLSERGVACKDCNGAEKGEVIKQVSLV
jgi:hypothetical protein